MTKRNEQFKIPDSPSQNPRSSSENISMSKYLAYIIAKDTNYPLISQLLKMYHEDRSNIDNVRFSN